jgi:hypothetical protein
MLSIAPMFVLNEVSGCCFVSVLTTLIVRDFCIGFHTLVDSSSQDGMLNVPDWMSLRGGRRNRGKRNRSGRQPRLIVPVLVGVLLRVTTSGLVLMNNCLSCFMI